MFKNVLKSVFNATNLNGLGAVFLSAGMGSDFGTALFGGAILVGTWNKYTALTSPELHASENSSWLTKTIRDPALTAKILMGAAGYNFLDGAVDMALQDGLPTLQETSKTAAWLFGVLGDNALRKLDHANFTSESHSPQKPIGRITKSVQAALANPSLFYNASGIALSLAMLDKAPLASPQFLLGTGVAVTFAAGIAHTLRRTFQAAQGTIPTDQINDGALNVLSAAGLAEQSLFAGLTGNYPVATAQAIFTTSALKALYETRSALQEASPPPAP